MGIESLWIEIQIGKTLHFRFHSLLLATTYSNVSDAIYKSDLYQNFIKKIAWNETRANLLRLGLIGSWVCFEQTRAISGNTRSFQSFTLLEEDKYWKLWKSGSMYAAFGNSGSRERISADNYSNSLHNSCFIIRAFLLKKLLFPTVHLGQYSWIPLKLTLRNNRAAIAHWNLPYI